MSFYIVVKLLLLGFALVSYLIYQSRRSANHDALQVLRRTPVTRPLTEPEIAALEPLKVTENLLFQPEVRRLTGPYRQHGVSINSGTTLHDTINDVTVLMPYDAPAFVGAENDAEVVISGDIAIVVTLNGFDVVGGRQRAVAGTPATAAATDAAPARSERAPGSVAPAALTTPTADSVEWLHQRTETAVEAQLRLQQRWKKALALAWLATAILLWLGACPLGRIAQTMFILGGLGCVLVGILLALRRPRADALPRRQVDRARGPLLMFTQRAAGNAAVVNTHALLGDSLKLHLPAHWRNSGRVTSGESVEIEVDRDSGRVLGLGNGWSLEDEQRRFPEARWRTPLLLSLVGGFALMLSLAGNDGVIPKLKTSIAAIMPGKVREDASAQSLLKNPPSRGDTLQLSGTGFCAPASHRDDSGEMIAGADCLQIRWGGKPVKAGSLQLDPALMALYSGNYLQTRRSSSQAMLTAMMAGTGNYPLGASPSVLEVSGLHDLVALLETVCATASAECDALKSSLARALQLEVHDENGSRLLTDWPALAQELRKLGDFPPAFNSIELNIADVENIRGLTRDFASADIAHALSRQTAQILAQGEDGVTLAMDERVADPSAEDADSGGDYGSGDHHGANGLLEQWQRTQQLLGKESPFQINARVIGVTQTGNGLRVELSALDGDPSKTPSAIGGTLLLLLTLALLGSQLPRLFIGIRDARRRRTALTEDMRKRPPPGQQQMF